MGSMKVEVANYGPKMSPFFTIYWYRKVSIKSSDAKFGKSKQARIIAQTRSCTCEKWSYNFDFDVNLTVAGRVLQAVVCSRLINTGKPSVQRKIGRF